MDNLALVEYITERLEENNIRVFSPAVVFEISLLPPSRGGSTVRRIGFGSLDHHMREATKKYLTKNGYPDRHGICHVTVRLFGGALRIAIPKTYWADHVLPVVPTTRECVCRAA